MLRSLVTALRWFAIFGALLGGAGQALAQAPVITSPPLSKLVMVGGTFSATVAATGASPLAYQWKRNGEVVPGATAATINVANAAVSDGGWYQVEVTNAAGSTKSVFRVDVVSERNAVIAWGDYDAMNIPAGVGNAVGIAAGRITYVLRADGSVVAWDTWGGGPAPVLTHAVRISAGAHLLAVQTDGTVAAAGDNFYGQATVPASLLNVVAVAAGQNFSLALHANGRVDGWGNNDVGQTVSPATATDLVDIAAGTSHALALRADGTVVAWGFNSSGQATVPAGLGNVIAIAGGAAHSLALRRDGTVAAWGSNLNGQCSVPAGLTNVVRISAGEAHSVALRTDGTVVVWGSNYYGGAAAVPLELGISNVQAIAAGYRHNVVLVPAVPPKIITEPAGQSAAPNSATRISVAVTGTRPLIYVWKKDGVPLPVGTGRISGTQSASLVLTALTAADAGAYQVEISNAAGTVTSKAANLVVVPPPTFTTRPSSRRIQIGQPATFTAAATGNGAVTYQWRRHGQPIAGATDASLTFGAVTFAHRGAYEVVATDAAGGVARSVFYIYPTALAGARSEVFSWGHWSTSLVYPPAIPRDPMAVSAGDRLNLVLEAAGTVFEWGEDYFNQASVPAGLSEVVAVAAGRAHAIALKADGRVSAWGESAYSQPGGLRDVTAVAAGDGFSVALCSDGTLAEWGSMYLVSMSDAASVGNIVSVAAGAGGILAVRADGTLACLRNAQQSPPPAGLNSVKAVSVGASHYLALKEDGTVVGWGTGAAAEIPAGLSNVVEIDAGAEHSIAIKSDGSVVAWGGNAQSQATVPTRARAALAASAGRYHSVALVPAMAPAIAVQPVSRSVFAGSTVMLSVSVVGAEPVSYEWRKSGAALVNGGAISGANTNVLTLTNVQASHAGDYTVFVSDATGSVTSVPATVTVLASTGTPPNDQFAATQVLSSTTSGLETGHTVGATGELGEPAHVYGDANSANSSVWFAWTAPNSGRVQFIARGTDFTAAVAAYTGASVDALSVEQRSSANAIGGSATLSFAVRAGTTYRIAVAAVGATRGSFQLSWQLSLAPPNDDFANAVVLRGSSGSVDGDISTATTDPGHFGPYTSYSSVWYSWTAPANGAVTFDIPTTSYPTETLNVYIGSSPGDSMRVASAQGYSAHTRAKVTIKVTGGVTYRIAVGTSADNRGAFTLRYGFVTAPVFATQPVSRTAGLGDTIAFSATLEDPDATYQWFHDGRSIAGATAATLNRGPLERAHAGRYFLRATNAAGTTDSNVVTISGPNPPPTITTAPSDALVTAGQPVAVSVAASGVGPLAYEWRRHGVALPTQTTATFTIPSATRGDADLYDAVVWDGLSATKSPPFRLAVAPTSYPGYVAYQTAANGPGSTSSRIRGFAHLPGGKLLLGGNFDSFGGVVRPNLVRLNADGTVDAEFTSALDPYDRLAGFLVQPDGRIVTIDTSGDITRLHADGRLDASFVPAVRTESAARVVAANLSGGRIIVPWPEGPAGNLAVLYQDGTRDETFMADAKLRGRITFIAGLRDGRILVRGYFNLTGTSEDRTVRLTPDGSIDSTFALDNELNRRTTTMLLLPDDRLLVGGNRNNAGFLNRIELNGFADPGFNAELGGRVPNGLFRQEDGKIIVLEPMVRDGLGRQVSLMRLNANGSRDPAFIALGHESLVDPLVMMDSGECYGAEMQDEYTKRWGKFAPAFGPSFTSQPTDQSTAPGGTVTFTVAASGTPPLYYKWSFNGIPLTGTTGASLTITNVQAKDIGSYQVAVSNDYGAITSNAATLKGLNPYPVITTQPQPVSAVTGQSATLTVAATGTGALTYQWRLNGTALAGATTSTLNIGASTLAHAGSYDVVISDGLSQVISQLVRVAVAPASYPQVLSSDPGFRPVFETAGGYPGGFTRLPDGRVIAFGWFSRFNNTAASNIVRLTAIGNVDPTFDAGAINGPVYAVAAQADGRLVIGGAFTRVAGQSRWGVARLLPNGALDPTFTPTGNFIGVYALALHSDLRVVLGGAFPGRLARVSASGATDPAFAPAPNGVVNAVVVQSDGKVVAGGAFTSVAGQSCGRLARLNADGSFDAGYSAGCNDTVYAVRLIDGDRTLVGGAFYAFNGVTAGRIVRVGNDGRIDLGWSTGTGFNSTVYALDVLADGRILAGGAFGGFNGVQRLAVARLLNGGALDTTFTPVAFTHAVIALSSLSDGTVFVGGGFTSLGGTTHWNIAQLTAAGSAVNHLFGPGLLSPGEVTRVVPDIGGRLIVGGSFTHVDNAPRTSLVRLEQNGQLDPTFGVGGGPNGAVTDILRLPGGKLFAIGSFTAYSGAPARQMALLSSEGTLDPSFSGALSGWDTALVPRHVSALPGGRFVISNGEDSSVPTRVSVVRASGDADSSFFSGSIAVGSGGVRVTRGQLDGSVLIGGSFTAFNNVRQSHLARLRPNGELDAAFAPVVDDAVTAVVLQPDGRILIAGDFLTVNSRPRPRVARLNPDGTLDETFAPDFSLNDGVTALSLQPDGRVLVAGDFVAGGGYPTLNYVLRTHADGRLDTSFCPPPLAGGPRDVVLLDDGTIVITGSGLRAAGMPAADVIRSTSAPGPVALIQPAGREVTAGTSLSLAFSVAGGEALTYQWYRDGVPLPGQTKPTLFIGSTQAADAGVYSVRATHRGGTLVSANAIVTVSPSAPAFGSAFIGGFGGTIKNGSRWALTAPPLLAGSGPIVYQWNRDGASIAGATNATYNPISWQSTDAGVYTVTATNSAGSVTTEPFQQLVTHMPDADWHAPSPQGNSLSHVVFLNGRFLAGGSRGTILESANGTQWNVRRLGVANTVFAFAFGNGTHVALSSYGGIWTSTDTVTWTPRDSGVGANGDYLNGIAFGSGRFVAVGGFGVVAVSSDNGATWSKRDVGSPVSLYEVAYGNGRFIAIGSGGRTFISADGVSWSAGPVLSRSITTIAFGAGRFVIGGGKYVYSSVDGSSWSQSWLNTTDIILSLQYNEFGFVTTMSSTDGKFWISADGSSWTSATLGDSQFTAPRNAIAYGAGGYVSVGAAPESLHATKVASSFVRAHFEAVTTSSAALVGVGSGGYVWFSGAPGDVPVHSSVGGDFTDVAAGSGMYVGVTKYGGIYSAYDGGLRSTGYYSAWRSEQSSGGVSKFNGVTYIDNRFFAVGTNGAMYVSLGNGSWVPHTTGTTAALHKVAYGGGMYVAVGAAGTILSSPESLTWTRRAVSGITTTIRDVIYADGKFILVSEGGSIRTSADGITWTTRTNPTEFGLCALAYGGGKVYAAIIGNTDYLVSADGGVTWSAAQHGSANETTDVAVFGDRVYFVGRNGSIISLMTNVAAPTIAAQPVSQTVTARNSATLSVSASGGAPLYYQWFKNGKVILGATSSSLVLPSVTVADSGTYTVTVANAGGVATSSTATLTVNLVPPGITASLAQAQGGASALGGVFTVEGAAAKQVLVRVLGPALANFGVGGYLDDPRISIASTSSESEFATNDDWSTAANAAQVATVSAQVGASPLTSGSKDAAVLAAFPPGTYRVTVGPAGASGVASVQIYDADTTPRLVYLATRGHVGAAGVISQALSLAAAPAGRSYLIRALGPSTGLGAALADPRVAVYSGSTLLVANDNWSGDAELASLAARAGAMPIPAASRDAALKFVPATTGVYTLQVASANGTSGTALLEVFECDADRATSVPVAMVSLPDHVTVNAGEPAAFGVVAVGRPAPNFQWSKGGVALAGANTPGLALRNVQLADAGSYAITINNGVGVSYTATATLTVTPANNARHAVVGSGYTPGGTVTIANTIHYTGTPASLGWSVELPAGWSFASDSGSAGDVKPAVGATGTLAWSWSTPPPSPVTFTYTLNVPAAESVTRTLSASATIGAAAIAVQPAPLSVFGASRFHSVDIDRDAQLSLVELTRIIELYNTRHGPVRTGAYRPQEATEDGFAAEPLRPGGVAVLDRHHAADTNRDGAIGLAELTRVIQLYNFRAGSVRTGQYHVETGTEDGFAPGP